MQFAALTTGCSHCNDRGPFLVHYPYIKNGAIVADPWAWGFECYVCRADWPAREQDLIDAPKLFEGRPK